MPPLLRSGSLYGTFHSAQDTRHYPGMAWPTNPRPAKALLVLRDQIDTRWPNRDKSSDGMLGDVRHQATKSDHNPNAAGVVTAIDITNDPAHGPVARELAEDLLASRDPRIKYVISNRQICSSLVSPWVWRPYNGANAHEAHCHISVMDDPALYDSQLAWRFGMALPLPAFPNSGKGSWYSQFVGKFTWVDTGDAPGSAALGVPDDAQGVSFMDSSTLGKWFQVRAPNGVISLEQQTDIGPNPNTGRLIDISAAAAERFGYSPRNFPTDGIFSWQQVPAPASVAGLTPQQAALKIRDGRASSPPFHPPILPSSPVPTPPPTTEPPMDLFKFLPLLMRIFDILPKIQAAAKSGTNIFTLLQTFAPDLLSILTGVGSTLFPTLPPDSQAKVGSIMLDPTKVQWIQNALNTLGLASPPLIVDGQYGQKTKAAVIAFQTANNVTPADGWAGDITEAALRNELNKKAAPAPTTPTATGPTVSLALPTP